jgi:nitroimidazol reductase NimA-like FMN-containing flavoprotein (pyridoxamine 5'-phosphate oxidase superfamily)
MAEQSWLEELPALVCLQYLRQESIGRLAIIVNEAPVILPVNYRVAEPPTGTWLVIRTRPGNVIDRAGMHVALEIDGVDHVHHEGWSVLVRGTMHHVDADAADFRERFDPEPWLLAERDSWLVIEPFAITGRRLHAAAREWAFHVNAYL